MECCNLLAYDLAGTMTNRTNFILYSLVLIFIFSCSENKDTADLVLLNGNFYAVDKSQPAIQALAIQADRIFKIGTTEEINTLIGEETKVIDLKGSFVMPGFIEGHGHFSGIGYSLNNLNFLTSENWDEIINMVAEKAKTAKPGEWITGRGWHQEKWNKTPDRQVLGYPYHDKLSEVSPNNPVVLRHASGHGLFANAKAMEEAGINLETPNPSGGEIVRSSSGDAIGVFEERAMRPIMEAYAKYLEGIPDEEKYNIWLADIEAAQKECIQKGITSFQDAGSSYLDVERYSNLAKAGKLDLRLWVMLRHSAERMQGNLSNFPIMDLGNHFFTCKAIKTEVDGALGSYGAWLLKPYHDKPGFIGQNTTTIEEVAKIADLAYEHNMQLCVHAIGDRANQEVLNIIERKFQTNPSKTDLRWRIEHAQHLHPDDIPRFKALGVIASMQGIHCTSDAPFVVKRLGEQRAQEGAYPWRSLLDNGVIIANGTDAPVEDVDPIQSFYASVTRKRADSGFEFFPEQRMTREEALYSYTLGNAYAAFEEDQKGSLTEGKLADIVVLSQDLLNCTDEEILKTKILYTIVGGNIKYETL